jgi:RHS repeat-associated protein
VQHRTAAGKHKHDTHWRRYGVYRKPAGWAGNDPAQTTLIAWDTAVNGWGRVASVTQGEGRTVESYEYTVGGLVTKKRLGLQGYDTTLEAVYSWNQAGQMTSMKYPNVFNENGTVAAAGRTLNFSYSYLGTPAAMTDPALPWGSQTVASGVWNGAGQMTQLSVRKPDATMDVENFTFNDRGQLLQQSGRGVNIEYRYSLTANDGRLASRKDNVSGEEVSYQYDTLGRLISAATTGTGGWGLSWGYDGFGNRLTQSVTKGTGPVVNLTVNAATNRISSSGFVYDANGNQTQWPAGAGTTTAVYDVQNRMTSVATANGTEGYTYSAGNQRVLAARSSGTVETLFYGLGGELLGIYGRTQKASGKYYLSSVIGTRIWFAGRLIESNGSAVARDRLGSVEKNGATLTHYYPYGEEQGGATAANKEKFATYTRDAVSGLDYAVNRYYSSTWGRFTSADPYQASGGVTDPQSWNRYSYVRNDPVNYSDPRGLDACWVGAGEGREMVECQSVTFVIPSAMAHSMNNYAAYMSFYASGIGKAKQALKEIGKGEFKSKESCREFFKALIKAAGLKTEVDALMDQVAVAARDAQSYVYDGVHSGTELSAQSFPSTGSQDVNTVSQWFAADGSRQALSQSSGLAIFIRPDQWTPHTGMMTGFISGEVNEYGMGTMLHELLHKQMISGGFSHQTMNTALTAVGMGASNYGLYNNRQSEQIGKLCF